MRQAPISRTMPTDMTADALECARDNCFAPTMRCVMGHGDSCPHFRTEGSRVDESSPGAGLPWSGLALGSADMQAIAALGSVRLVAFVGAHNSGKTTALAASIVARRRGSHASGTFAGSYTLIGWNQIARHLAWLPHGSGFPPHTTTAGQRVPSLLHLELRGEAEDRRHVLYTDVPGEWYSAWAYDAGSHPACEWIAQNADAFVLFADSDALSGPERGRARGDYETLAMRVATAKNNRPVVPVRSKADLEIPEAIRDHLDQVNVELFGQKPVPISVKDGPWQGITEAGDLGTAAAVRPRKWPLAQVSLESDPFLTYRSLERTQ
ncbi:MAG: hypothetical protein JWR63_3342 [Conexibacter sp.]|nr:hypothetical protein [Conexibacter sp.]